MTAVSLVQVLEAMSGWVRNVAPRFLIAAAWLFVGWILARICLLVVKRIVGSTLRRVEARIQMRGPMRTAGLWRVSPKVIGEAVYWTVLLCFAAVAVQELSLPIAAAFIQDFTYWLPKVGLALVLTFVGASLGGLAYHWITEIASMAGVSNSGFLGRTAQAGIIAVTMIVGMQLVGLDESIFVSIMTVVLATTLGGMALAFGLGAGPVVSNIMASYYASKALAVGNSVRIGGAEGIVHEITATSVVVDAGGDRIHVPAKKFCEEECVVFGGSQ